MILHLVRCDSCKSDQPMTVSPGMLTMNGYPQPAPPPQLSVPSSIKQIDGRHFCSWACVANYAETQQGER